jgi:hypothetical protein
MHNTVLTQLFFDIVLRSALHPSTSDSRTYACIYDFLMSVCKSLELREIGGEVKIMMLLEDIHELHSDDLLTTSSFD